MKLTKHRRSRLLVGPLLLSVGWYIYLMTAFANGPLWGWVMAMWLLWISLTLFLVCLVNSLMK